MRRVRTQPVAILFVFHRLIAVITKEYGCIGRHLLSQALPIAKHQKYSPRYFSSVLRSPCEDSPSPFLLRQGHGAVASPNPQTNTRQYRLRHATAARLRHLSAASPHCPTPLLRLPSPQLDSATSRSPCRATRLRPQTCRATRLRSQASVAATRLLPPLGSLAALPTLPSRIHRRNPSPPPLGSLTALPDFALSVTKNAVDLSHHTVPLPTFLSCRTFVRLYLL